MITTDYYLNEQKVSFKSFIHCKSFQIIQFTSGKEAVFKDKAIPFILNKVYAELVLFQSLTSTMECSFEYFVVVLARYTQQSK